MLWRQFAMEKIYRILIQRIFIKMQSEFIIGMTDNNTIACTRYTINTKYINLTVVVFCQNNSPHQKCLAWPKSKHYWCMRIQVDCLSQFNLSPTTNVSICRILYSLSNSVLRLDHKVTLNLELHYNCGYQH